MLRITPSAETETVSEGLVTVGNPCLSGGSLDIFLEAMLPPVLVHVHGEAPVARAMLDLGRALGYDVRPAPTDDPLPADLAAVVVASHGRAEEPVLTSALRAGVPYVALVASPRRGRAVVASLEVADELRARVHSPAGLDIGARTPAEIALSIYAELIAGHPTVARAPAPSLPADAIDPVCGMTVATGETALSLRHADLNWYFCGPGCRQAFADDPERYLGEANISR